MSLSDIQRPRQSFNLAIGVTSSNGAGTPVPSGCSHMRLASTSDCYVFISSTGTARTAVADGSGMLIRPSTGGEVFRVAPGDIISCIQVSAGGVLNVSYMTS